MKHYVLRNNTECRTRAADSQRRQPIDIILADPGSRTSAEMIVDFYRALNDLLESQTYVINLRVMAGEPAGGPMYWTGRTAIFWGDIQAGWKLSGQKKAWVSQVLNLSTRSVLVGGAVLLLAQLRRNVGETAAIHPNFVAAAQEVGLTIGSSDTHRSAEGRTHSASSPLAALRLMADFVSLDHGEHMAGSLREYIGLTTPQRTCASQVAARLIRRSGADPIVKQAVELMLKNVEDPLRISDLSEALGTSTRQLQRRFLAKTGEKLLTTYRELRVERAHNLLRYTDLPRREVSAATGFSSVTALGRAFRACYKVTPECVRKQRFSGQLTDPTALQNPDGF